MLDRASSSAGEERHQEYFNIQESDCVIKINVTADSVWWLLSPDFVISVMKACYYWSHKLNLLTSFHTPGPHVVTTGQCPMSRWPHILPPMPPGHQTTLLSRDCGDFWSPHTALPLTQVWSRAWSLTLAANITLMSPWHVFLSSDGHYTLIQ